MCKLKAINTSGHSVFTPNPVRLGYDVALPRAPCRIARIESISIFAARHDGAMRHTVNLA